MPTMKLLIRALLGGVVVAVISALSGTGSNYVAGLVPLFPTLTLMSHVIVGTERTQAELKATIRFGIWSMIPYATYMVVLYVLVDRMRLQWALLSAVVAWFVSAAVLLLLWNRG